MFVNGWLRPFCNEHLCEKHISCTTFFIPDATPAQLNCAMGNSCTVAKLRKHPRLQHVDLRLCNLTELEILFICQCIKASETQSLKAIHLGYNTLTNFGRALARSIMGAWRKKPFVSTLHVTKELRNSD